MITHYAVLLVKNSPDNPEGLPAEWHRDARASGPTLDPSLQSIGYQLMTTAEFEARQQTYASDFEAWKTSRVRVPEEVLLWQFRAAVILAGLEGPVLAAIAGLPEPSKTVATQKWEYGNTIRRNHPMIAQLSALIGITSTQVDEIFKTASSLS